MGEAIGSTHLLFISFSCGHEFYFYRDPGSVSGDWDNCLCDYCQPYDAILLTAHPCCFCDGSLEYRKDDPQTRLSEAQAKQRIENTAPRSEAEKRKEERLMPSVRVKP